MTELPIAIQEEEIASFCRKSILSNLEVIYAACEDSTNPAPLIR